MSAALTPKRSLFRLGMVGLVAFPVMLVASVVGMWIDPPVTGAVSGMVFVGLVWSFFIGLSAWLVLSYYRDTVLPGEHELRIGSRRVASSDIKSIVWSRQSLTIYFRAGRKTIHLSNFTPQDQLSIIRLLRRWVTPKQQRGWKDAIEQEAIAARDAFTPARHAAFMRSLTRVTLWTGVLGGLVCGVVLQILNDRYGVNEFTLTGWHVVEWTFAGLLSGFGLMGMFLVLCDSPPDSAFANIEQPQ
jgi:hypothetical protein